MAIGIVKGVEIALNKDGDKKRLLLQVEIIEDDVKTVELISQQGEDVNPAVGARAFVLPDVDSYQLAVAISDDLLPEVNPGEKELYSTDSPATAKLARLKFNAASELVLNQGTDFAVEYTALKTAFDQLKTEFNALVTAYSAHVHTTVTSLGTPTVPIPPGVSSTADMTASKVDKVRL